MKEWIQEIVGVLKQARLQKGLSQRELSTKTKIPQGHLSKIEQGLIDLQASSLIELARALELEVMLIPRSLLNAVEGMLRTPKDSRQIPAYRLNIEEEGDESEN